MNHCFSIISPCVRLFTAIRTAVKIEMIVRFSNVNMEYIGTAYFSNSSPDNSISYGNSAIENTSEIATVMTSRRLAVILNSGLSV